MSSMSTGRRSIQVACLILALAFAGAQANRAKADGNIFQGLAALAYLAVVGTGLAVLGMAAAVKAANAPASASALPPTASVRNEAQPAQDNAFAAGQRQFLALPRCDAVGGYEAYFKRTGEVCRLY